MTDINSLAEAIVEIEKLTSRYVELKQASDEQFEMFMGDLLALKNKWKVELLEEDEARENFREQEERKMVQKALGEGVELGILGAAEGA